MVIIFPILMFVLLAVGVSLFGYIHYVRPGRMLDQLAGTTSEFIASPLTELKRTRGYSISKMLEPIGNILPISTKDAAVTKRELYSAGFRSVTAVPVFYGAKISMAVVLVLGALVLRDRLDNPLLRLILPIAAGGIGYILPGFMLGRLVKRRHDRIRLSLPDVLDLLVISTEAGCGLDQAIVNVSRELKHVHKAVSEDLSIVNMEIMAGKARADALRNFARRTGEEEVKKLVAILLQTDRFGTSVSEALRTQSDYLRIRRRQEAEERAGKVGVKLVFPIFFFCLPSLLIVTAGPGILSMFNNLFPALKGLQ